MNGRVRSFEIAFACIVSLGIVLSACASAATLTAGPGESVELTLSRSNDKADIDIDGRHYRLVLLQIVDSRCPANAKCIWAGELAARLSIERVDQRGAIREITLGESTVPSMEIMGLRLALVTIDETSLTLTVEDAAGR